VSSAHRAHSSAAPRPAAGQASCRQAALHSAALPLSGGKCRDRPARTTRTRARPAPSTARPPPFHRRSSADPGSIRPSARPSPPRPAVTRRAPCAEPPYPTLAFASLLCV